MWRHGSAHVWRCILDICWTPPRRPSLWEVCLARSVRDASLETRAARARLKPNSKPYYRALEPGLHLGYRKPQSGAGKWVARHYVGQQAYEVETIATADDFSDPDGVAVLSFRQAQEKARERMVLRAHAAAGKQGPLTVRAAVESYLEFLEHNRKSALDARYRAKAFIYPELGDIEVHTLTADHLRKWHADLAKAPARLRTKRGQEQRHRARTGDDGGPSPPSLDGQSHLDSSESCTEPHLAGQPSAVGRGMAARRAV